MQVKKEKKENEQQWDLKGSFAGKLTVSYQL